MAARAEERLKKKKYETVSKMKAMPALMRELEMITS